MTPVLLWHHNTMVARDCYISKSSYVLIYHDRTEIGPRFRLWLWHHSNYKQDVIMNAMTSQVTVVWCFCSTVCSGADERKYQSFASLAFVRKIRRWPVNSSHNGPVTWKMFPFDDVIMILGIQLSEFGWGYGSVPSKWQDSVWTNTVWKAYFVILYKFPLVPVTWVYFR